MDFNTLIFLGFFAGVAVLTYCVPRPAKPYLWLLASYAFICTSRKTPGWCLS